MNKSKKLREITTIISGYLPEIAKGHITSDGKWVFPNHKQFEIDLEQALEANTKEVVRKVELEMIENILFIGNEIPQGLTRDDRDKFILLGYPQKFLDSLTQSKQKG